MYSDKILPRHLCHVGMSEYLKEVELSGQTKTRGIVYCILSWECYSGTMSDVGADPDTSTMAGEPQH